MPHRDPPDLRPITARALQSVMDTLRPYLYGAHILDLYSGKGRFGLAAVDEGAESITFVEKNRTTAQQLRKSVKDRSEFKVLTGDAIGFLKQAKETGEQYSIVFADPPFRIWNETFARDLFENVGAVLTADSIFLVRYPKRMITSLPTGALSSWKTSVFGESELLYLRAGG